MPDVACNARCRAECEKHRTFRCNVCERRVPWDDGGDDCMPKACAACWYRAHMGKSCSTCEPPRCQGDGT